MSDLEDFDLGRDSSASQSGPPTSPPTPPPRKSILPLVGVGLAVVAVLVTVFWLLSRDVEPLTPTSATEPENASGEGDTTGEEDRADTPSVESLPPLAESDGFVRVLLRELTDHPVLPTWLAPPYLVKRLAAAVENVGLGASPVSHLAALAPAGPYRALDRNGLLEPDPSSYRRYDLMAQVFSSLDADTCANVYRRLRPLFQEAYADLGYPDQNFDDALAEAMSVVLSTPIPAQPPALEKMVESYRYVDPELESLTAAQKHFLRMGPGNMRRVKAQLRQIAAALELEVN